MRKLLIALLLLNAVCLFAICQPLAVLAGSGSGGGSDPCSADPTKYALDTNGDEVVDLSDFVAGLSWFFSGGTAPRVCLDTTDLEASLAQAEGHAGLQRHPVSAIFVCGGGSQDEGRWGSQRVEWGKSGQSVPGVALN